jgi:hypothetical protein
LHIVAILHVYNEARFMPYVLQHLAEQGVDTYVVDNESTDGTAEIARRFLGRGVIGVETMPRRGVFELKKQLVRSEALHRELGADWYLHQDADQWRYAPNPHRTLAEGIAAVDAAGFNAIEFDVFDFMPTGPDEDHDHGRFVETMRWYYYFRPPGWHQLKVWKNFGQAIDLASTAGHHVKFDGLRVSPVRFIQRHYYVLSRAHAIEKYCKRSFSAEELASRWHGARATIRSEDLRFPARETLHRLRDDNTWDTSRPQSVRQLFVAAPQMLRPDASKPSKEEPPADATR